MHTLIIITVVCRPAKSSSKCSAITMCAAFTVFLCCLCQTLQCRVLFTALCYCAVYMQSKDLQANVVCLCVVCRKHLLCTSRFRKWLHFETMRHFARWCGPVRKPNDITARNPDLDDVCILGQRLLGNIYCSLNMIPSIHREANKQQLINNWSNQCLKCIWCNL